MSESVEQMASRLGVRLPNTVTQTVLRRLTQRKKRRPSTKKRGVYTNNGPVCRKGHPYGESPPTKIVRKGGKDYVARMCIECKRAAQRRYQARRRAA